MLGRVSRPDLHPVALHPGVIAFHQPPGGWFVSNAGLVTGRDAALQIDTFATEPLNRRLETAIDAYLEPGTRRTVALTHAHGDHAHGAGRLAAAGATILATPPAAGEVLSGPHTYDFLFSCDWGAIDPPSGISPVTEPRDLDLGGTSVTVVPAPGPAHTHGDLVVWHAESGTLFTGDLLFLGVTPLALAGSIAGWLEALTWLETFGATTYVPGHGPVTAAADDPVADVREYFEWLREAVGGFDERAAIEAAARARWPEWGAGERHGVNARIAYSQAHGVELDFPAGVRDLLSSAAAHGEPMTETRLIRLDL